MKNMTFKGVVVSLNPLKISFTAIERTCIGVVVSLNLLKIPGMLRERSIVGDPKALNLMYYLEDEIIIGESLK